MTSRPVRFLLLLFKSGTRGFLFLLFLWEATVEDRRNVILIGALGQGDMVTRRPRHVRHLAGFYHVPAPEDNGNMSRLIDSSPANKRGHLSHLFYFQHSLRQKLGVYLSGGLHGASA